MNLSQINAVILDMDGVLWRGDAPLPGLAEFFDWLRAHNLPYALATNNSAKTQADYVHKLAAMDVLNVPETRIITSGTATVAYMQNRYPVGTRVHVLGGDGLRAVVGDAGYTLVDQHAEVVVVGTDFNLTYERLRKAMLLLLTGAAFIGTNADVTYPLPDGLAPGAGSIIAALVAATGCQPLVIGKPQPPMFEAALRLLGSSAEHTLMIGDRLETDILGAQQVGLRTALVLTGVTSRAESNASNVRPDGVYEDLPALMAAWNSTN